MQIVETIRTGGVFALLSEVDANGTPRWKVEESQVSNNPSHVLQYPKELDAEILNAMGIADDVLKSEATGSWAGKAVPQQATYCILEQWLSDLVCDVDRVIEKLVEINFGPGHQYEITTRPLADQMLAQQNGESSSITAQDAPGSAGSPGARMRMGLADSDWLRMSWNPNQPRAPIGGVRINGTFYPGGQFIPLEDFNRASSEERAVFEEKWRAQDTPSYGEEGGPTGPPTPEQSTANKAKPKFVKGGRIEGYDETIDHFTQEELDHLNELAKQAWGMRNNHPAMRGDEAARSLDAFLGQALGREPNRKAGWEWPYQDDGPKVRVAPKRTKEEEDALWADESQRRDSERAKLEYIAQWAHMMRTSLNTAGSGSGSAGVDLMSGRYQLFTTIHKAVEAFRQGAQSVVVDDPNTGKPIRIARDQFNVDEWFALATNSSDALWTKQRIDRINDALSTIAAAKPEKAFQPDWHTRLWISMGRNGKFVPQIADHPWRSSVSPTPESIRHPRNDGNKPTAPHTPRPQQAPSWKAPQPPPAPRPSTLGPEPNEKFDASKLDKNVLWRIRRKSSKGHEFGPGHRDPPTLEEFNARIHEVSAADLETIVIRKHLPNDSQRQRIRELSNDELLRFDYKEPLGGTADGDKIRLQDGHHRAEEIARRVAEGLLPPDTKVRI